MKKKVRKLELAKETLQTLSLSGVQGGASDLSCPDLSCFPYYCQRQPYTGVTCYC
jgi:hypothetical protein